MQKITIEQALNSAVNYQRNGKLNNAAEIYCEILKIQPNHTDANHNLGTLNIQTGQYLNSLPYFKVALENRPDFGQYWLSYIQALILNNRIEQANSVINQSRQFGLQGQQIDILENRAGKYWATRNLTTAIAYREAGAFSDAIIIIEKWIEDNEIDAEVLALYSQLLCSAKNLPKAWKAINKALKLNHTSLIVQRNYARLLLRENRFSEALTAAQIAYDLDNSDPESQAMLAATEIANNQLESASKLLDCALNIWPHYAEAFANRAQLKLRLNDQVGALADVRQSLAIKPHLSQVRLLEVSLLQNLGDNTEVMTALEQYLKLDPNDIPCIISLGERKRIANCLDQAEALLKLATELAPQNASAWSNWGIVLHQSQQLDKAKVAFQRALEIDIKCSIAAHNLGAMALTGGDVQNALKYFQIALKSTPEQGETLLHLGHALYDTNNSIEALNAYQNACTLNTMDGSGLRAGLYMAILHYLDGELEQCAERLVYSRLVSKKGTTSDPSDSIYWSYLATLLSWHQKNSNAQPITEKDGVLFVVGESHSLATNNILLQYDNKILLCKAQWIAGIKQWHISCGKQSRTRSKFDAVISALPPCSTVLLNIGEIDCRHNEGILVAAKKTPEKPRRQIIENTIDGYISHTAELKGMYGHNFIISGIPAPNIPLENFTHEAREELISLIREFNLYLCKKAHLNGFDFLDLYRMTNRGDGISNAIWHIDQVHLTPASITTAFEKHLFKKQKPGHVLTNNPVSATRPN